MKKFSFKTVVKILVALALAFLLPVTNYIVDPAGLYTTDISGSVEDQAVNIMLSGKNAEGLVNYDERLVKRLCIYGLEDVDTLALGSSRVALIDSEMAGEDSFFNLAVTGAGLQDVIAMYGVSHMSGVIPERVIIALDPCFINSRYSSARFEQVLTDGYAYALTELMGYGEEAVGYSPAVNGKYLADGSRTSLLSYPADMLKELFSIPYFQNSISTLADSSADSVLYATTAEAGEDAMLRSDGSYCYPADYRGNSLAEITDLAVSQTFEVSENRARIIGCEDVDPNDGNIDLFHDFVEYLTSSGVHVDLVAVPLNPILWDYMLQHERYNPVIESVAEFRSIADELGCNIVGSFDPYEIGAEVEDFYDGYHYKPERMQALLNLLPKEK